MGQTLTHGVYLPDEGERNCYNGLAANWSILDGAVGTIAEHTSALFGKAPLVHTHTKSDVTDLFNSANTWTGDNTYSKTVAIERSTDTGSFLALRNSVAELGSTPASATPVTIAYRDKNDENLGYMGVYYDTDGSNHFRLHVRNKFTSGAPSTSGTADYAYFGLKLNADKSKEGILRASFRPYDNNAHDLGSSSYQWNNLYAKNYFYNGTAWGLDKANTWSKCQNFAGEYQGTEASNKYHTVFAIYSKYDTLGKSGMLFTKWRENKAQGALASSDLVQIGIDVLENEVRTNHVFNIQAGVFDSETGLCNTCNVISRVANANLGTSSYKWKTINGINPGALSLPEGVASNSIAVDITDWYIQDPDYPDDPTKKILDATNHKVDTAVPGWLHIIFPNVSGNWAYARQYAAGGNMGLQCIADGVASSDFANVNFIFPIYSSCYVRIKAKTATVRIFPCLGNVPSGV